MKDSLFEPRKIINHQKKSLFFLAFYFLILSLFMSLAAILFYAGYNQNSMMTEDSTGCSIVNNAIECTADSHDPSTSYDLYGVSFFLLDESENVSMISDMGSDALVIQGSNFMVYSNSALYMQWNVSTLFASQSNINDFFTSLKSALLASMIFINIVANIFIMVLLTLISTIPFSNLKKFLSYRDRFVLVGIALTPVAIIMTFYNLFQQSFIFLVFLLLFGYHSLTVMRRELLYKYLYPQVITPLPNQEQTNDQESDSQSSNQEEQEDDDSDNPKE